MKKYILSIDQGTTACRAIVFDSKLREISKAQKEITQIYPNIGWVEHDANEIYATQMGVVMEAVVSGRVKAEEIAAIGITNQRETTVVWNKETGLPIHNAIVWQCRRSADICEQLKNDGHADYIREATGLVVDAYFSGTKIKWILDNVNGARELANEGKLLFGTIDSFLVWKMTEGKVHVTDCTNASRTMLYNIEKLCWDEKLCALLNIPMNMLPEVKSSSEIYGYTSIDGIKIPISGIAGDQQAALFGQGCFEKGEAKNTYGTGCFLLMNTGDTIHKSKNGLLTTIAIGIDGKVSYALEGSIFVAGAAVQWLRDELGIIDSAAESEEIALSVKDNNGVYLIPAFTGLGAPYWDMYARGAIVGLSRGSNKAHIVRATLESIAFQTLDVLEAMQSDINSPLASLSVDGGACANNMLMQFQADILNVPVGVANNKETTALGAAALAGLAVGLYNDISEVKGYLGGKKIFLPQISDDLRQKYIKGWHMAVNRTLSNNA